jgi:hypothetical protein
VIRGKHNARRASPARAFGGGRPYHYAKRSPVLINLYRTPVVLSELTTSLASSNRLSLRNTVALERSKQDCISRAEAIFDTLQVIQNSLLLVVQSNCTAGVVSILGVKTRVGD